MASGHVTVNVQWGRELFQLPVDLDAPPAQFFDLVTGLTGLKPEQQKVFTTRGSVFYTTPAWNKTAVFEGARLLIVGADTAECASPRPAPPLADAVRLAGEVMGLPVQLARLEGALAEIRSEFDGLAGEGVTVEAAVRARVLQRVLALEGALERHVLQLDAVVFPADSPERAAKRRVLDDFLALLERIDAAKGRLAAA